MQQTDSDYSDESLIISIGKDHILPEAKYMFIEFYCCDPQCDCNSGAFQMVQLDSQGKETQNTIAMIDYRWNELISSQNPSLGPDCIGSKLAEAGLEEFKKLLFSDDNIIVKIKTAYADTRKNLKEHYIKEHYNNQYMPDSTIRNTKRIGRNEPCPCGSNKKYKKCCG